LAKSAVLEDAYGRHVRGRVQLVHALSDLLDARERA
jgi:hypothetical protein